MRQKFTEVQLVNQAAVELVDKTYRCYARFAWLSQQNDSQSLYYRGKMDAYEDAVKFLSYGEGEEFTVVEPPIYIDGRTLVAVNILGHGLYRSYIGGITTYYILFPYAKGKLSEANKSAIEGGEWIWLDPHRSNASEVKK